MKTNFENFRNLVSNTGISFDLICLTETWCNNCDIAKNSLFNLNNYNAVPFERKTKKKGGSVLISKVK